MDKQSIRRMPDCLRNLPIVLRPDTQRIWTNLVVQEAISTTCHNINYSAKVLAEQHVLDFRSYCPARTGLPNMPSPELICPLPSDAVHAQSVCAAVPLNQVRSLGSPPISGLVQQAVESVCEAAVRVSLPAAVMYRCDVAMDSWPSGFIRAYTLTSALASSVAHVWRSPCTRAPRARSASMPARRNAHHSVAIRRNDVHALPCRLQ